MAESSRIPQLGPRINDTQVISSPPAPFVSTAPDANDGLYDPIQLEFSTWAQSENHTNIFRLTPQQYREYKYWCLNPNEAAHNVKSSNNKSKAKKFEVHDGLLFRSAYDTKANKFGPREVILGDKAWETIKKVHHQHAHAKTWKVFKEIQSNYYGITEEEVNWVIENCHICSRNTTTSTKLPMRSVKAYYPWSHAQADLTDWRQTPSGVFMMLFQLTDLFSKFTFLWPLTAKNAQQIADAIAIFIGIVGPIKTLQFDNGGEFKGALLLLLRRHGIRIVNGSPYHPQSQGVVERFNETLRNRLRAWMADNHTTEWANGLIEVQMGMNSEMNQTTGTTPYELVFNRPSPFKADVWLDRQDRRRARLHNENFDHDDNEDSINQQVQRERRNPNEALPFQTPGVYPSFATFPSTDGAYTGMVAGVGSTPHSTPQTTHARQDKGKGKESVAQRIPKYTSAPVRSSPLRAEPLSSSPPLDFDSSPLTSVLNPQPHELQAAQHRTRDDYYLTSTSTPHQQLQADKQLARDIARALNEQMEDYGIEGLNDDGFQHQASDEGSNKEFGYAGPSKLHSSSPSSSSSGSLTSNSSSSSSESDSKDDNDKNEKRHHTTPSPPSEEPGIRQNILDARKKIKHSHEVNEHQYNKRYNTRPLNTYHPGMIVKIKLHRKNKPDKFTPLTVYGRVTQKHRGSYDVQTEYGVISRKLRNTELLPVKNPLASNIHIPDVPEKISLGDVAIRESTATHVRVSSRCKKMPCGAGRCSCRKNNVQCSIHCHGKDPRCDNEAHGNAFKEWATVPRPKGVMHTRSEDKNKGL